jgi:hypothetical protein
MQSALHVQPFFLEMSHLATAKNIPHPVLEFRLTETQYAAHLQPHLQAALLEHF